MSGETWDEEKAKRMIEDIVYDRMADGGLLPADASKVKIRVERA